jgi:hypothetical protein
MSGAKIIPILDRQLEQQRAERLAEQRACTEEIINFMEDELNKIQQILDGLQRRVGELEEGVTPAASG